MLLSRGKWKREREVSLESLFSQRKGIEISKAKRKKMCGYIYNAYMCMPKMYPVKNRAIIRKGKDILLNSNCFGDSAVFVK